ncbi:MAG TPA: threonine synthase [Vicinamibacterales bacterium]|nr:threonine synthase [Vicinamibacterales bacterium]
MICISTRGAAPDVPFRTALLAGLAPDGGLYVPSSVPVLPPAVWEALQGASLAGIGTALLAPLLEDEIASSRLHALLAEALDFPVPLVRLDERLSVLELFHGPTFAFKDVGARVLARLLSHFHDPATPPLTVLVATSGDTGGAVAHAFHRVPRTRVVVLYPEGQVSAVQEAQFTTLGDNVTAVSVGGTFDDCQRLAKEAFGRPDLRERAHLTSANSISLGRLLPQMVYFAHLALLAGPDPCPLVSVPSGNFGNLAAGLLARRMGAGIARFEAATTVNDTGPRYLATGRVEPRPSIATLANAMDVGHPSNLERIRWMFADRVEALGRVVSASVHTDADVRSAIRELDERYGYIADPHTAIAYMGARRRLDEGSVERAVFLSTAHPAKFGDVVGPIIGRAVGLPPALAEAVARPRHVVRVPPTLDALLPTLVDAARERLS